MAKRKITFRLGITQVFLLFTLLVAGAITLNFYQRVSDVVLDLSDQITNATAQRIIDNTSSFLGVPASYTAVVASYLENTHKQGRIVEDHEELWRLMWKPLLITPQLQSLFIADEGGNYVQVRRDPELASRVIDRSRKGDGVVTEYKAYRDEEFNLISEKSEETTFDPRERDWYKGAGRVEEPVWSGPFVSASAKTPVIAASQPVLDSRGGVRGVVGVHIPAYAISDALVELKLGPGEVMLVVDEHLDLIGFPKKDELVAKDDVGKPRLRRLGELGGVYAALEDALSSAPAQVRALELEVAGRSHRVLLARVPDYLGQPGWRVIWLIPASAPGSAPGTGPVATEARFPALAREVFGRFERPAQQVRDLAAHFPRGDEPLGIGPDHEALWRLMWRPLVEMPQLQSFFVADAQGGFVQVRREPFLATRLIDRSRPEVPATDRRVYRDEAFDILSDKTSESDFDPRDRPWYLTTEPVSRVFWSEIYVSTSAKTPVVAATHPVLRDGGSKAGVVAVNIPLYKVSDFVAESRVSPNGLMLIVDQSGRVVAYPDKGQILFNEPNGEQRLRMAWELDSPAVRAAYRQMSEAPGQRRFTFDLDGSRYIGVTRPFPQNVGQKDWTILAVIPEKDLLGEVDQMLVESAIITGVIFVLVVISVAWLARAVSLPIIRLAESMDGLSDFRLDQIQGVESRFIEIDRMSQSMLSARDGLGSFQKYVPADLVRLLIHTRQSASVGGEEAYLTVMFTDVEGFTSISENMPADELMLHLSEYLDALSRVILNEKGTIDKYIGDAIMAFWGAPVPNRQSAYHACMAALHCLVRQKQLNAAWRAAGKPPMNTRFGIHSGPIVVGNVGSDNRLNYTVIGDNVNLASRLEGINKFYGTNIILSEETYREVGHRFHCRLLDRVAVKGKRRGIAIYELIAPIEVRLPPARINLVRRYEAGLRAYWGRDWDDALDLFDGLAAEFPNDKAVALFLERCRSLRGDPSVLGDDWDGTYVFTSK